MNFTRMTFFGGSSKKLGEGIAQRYGHDQLGGGQTWANGADPGAERAPDQLGRSGGEDLEQALGDETELDMAMVGRELAADGVAVGLRPAMEVLVATHAAKGRHGGHPEVIGIGTEDADGLLEGDFDFEAQAIDADDVQGLQSKVSAHQQDGAALGMKDGDEADEDADGAPQQIRAAEVEGHCLLAIDGPGCLLEASSVLQ